MITVRHASLDSASMVVESISSLFSLCIATTLLVALRMNRIRNQARQTTTPILRTAGTASIIAAWVSLPMMLAAKAIPTSQMTMGTGRLAAWISASSQGLLVRRTIFPA